MTPAFFKLKPHQIRDDFGRLSVCVEGDRFSGRGGFWVQWQDAKAFGEALEAYPIPKEHPVIGQWGFGMPEGDDLILCLEIAPAGKLGSVKVCFEIADDYEPRNRVCGSFLTNYSNLPSFRVGIKKLMNHEVETAILNGQ
jgi:hypothetical protein